MADFLTREERSLLMSKIKGKNTGMEERFFQLLQEAGFRFRKYPKNIFGNPDAANKAVRIAFFFDSAFWHGYEWEKQKSKFGSNKKFWIQKIERNMARDKLVTKTLKNEGWIVVRIWENDMRKKERQKVLRRLVQIRKKLYRE